MPLLIGISAFLFWGFVPLFFQYVSGYDPISILVHRIFWSVIILQIFIYFRPESIDWKKTFKDKRSLILSFLAGLMLNLSWLGFLYATITDQLFAASLAFYMSPVLVFFMGYLFFHEKVTKSQWIVFLLLILAIIFYIAMNGEAPLLSLAIAVSFALYFTVKKLSKFTSFENVYFEHLLYLPLALFWIIYDAHDYTLTDNFLLFLTSPLQLIPIVLLGIAITKLDMKTLSSLQYIEPTIHLLLAIFVFHEAVNIGQLGATLIIWVALIYLYISKNRPKRVL